jgi:carboxymethylenebutenolidase
MPVTLLCLDIEENVDGASERLRGVLGVPDGAGPWPGVVVLHEAWGIDDAMRRQVEHLAELGYLALMPDLFSDGGFRRCISATMRAMSSGHGRAFADIEAARLAVLDRPECNGAVGVLGFCMGGGFALMTLDRGFDVASANYGMLPKDLDTAVENACPVVTSYGARDVTLRKATAKLDAALTRAGVLHDSKEYPDAGHVFMNESLNGPPFIRPLVRVLNFGPEPGSAKDAWARIDAFFGEHLASG